MLSISLLTIPVLVDTAVQPSQLLNQWARVYHYGHQVFPAISVTTCLLYAYSALRKRRLGLRWSAIALAGVTTLGMLPFTWIVMRPTIDALFAAQIESKAGQVTSWDQAMGLVATWALLHTTRSLFPLVGMALGWLSTLQEI
jgi:noranthrone monooxygenase